eukprot:PLAT12804.1.p2 GENE.PLAT12804.1~~PLAT12804.1.p2  ORF type:complete len:463 (+),score=203.83 PLAT12804.1:24-1412(+)
MLPATVHSAMAMRAKRGRRPLHLARSISTPVKADSVLTPAHHVSERLSSDGPAFDFVGVRDDRDLRQLSRAVEDSALAHLASQADADHLKASGHFDMASLLPMLTEGMGTVVDDEFSHCFESKTPPQWNWNAYLAPVWAVGWLVRHFILFPLRLLCLVCGFLVVVLGFLYSQLVMAPGSKQAAFQRWLIQFLCHAFVMSWSGVVRYHGVRPYQRSDGDARSGIFVANHSSMIDAIVLQQTDCFSMVGQQHRGWVGLLQKRLLSCLHCIWFERGQSKDRREVVRRLNEHLSDREVTPLLVFPEGTCVNNEFVVQFKKGVFEMDCTIYPIAIKYNKLFVDAFWNSRKESFQRHLFRLMTSWALVCDVWYLDPVRRRPEETAIDFAGRVQRLVAAKAGLRPVKWDGYMKYYRPSKRFLLARQKRFTNALCSALGMPRVDDAAAAAAAAAESKASGDDKSGLRHRK